MLGTDVIVDALAGWVGRQRWFAGKSAVPRLRIIGSWNLRSDQEVLLTTYLVLDESVVQPVLYQIPITQRRTPLEAAAAALITRLTDSVDTPVYLYDGPHDPAYAQAVLALITERGRVDGDRAWAAGVATTPLRCINVRSRVLGGEQSNTSIVYEFDPDPEYGDVGSMAICKIFRTLHHGENPDVILQSALFAAGSRAVPAMLGSIVGEWPDPREPSGRARGDLAFAQEFFGGAEDAWRRARAALASAADFTTSARAIGAATADIHATLAAAMPTVVADDADIADTVAAWYARLDAAIAEAPQIGGLRADIEAVYRRAAQLPWPRLQRIHGDLHLGQVLSLADGGWAIIDFEGEPMRPLAERTLPDVALRDVAGMLRSFDYVAGTQPHAPGATQWSEACRAAFISGYNERTGEDVMAQRELVDAFELDKALYEAVYEARNRPTWLPIPIAAIQRLAHRAGPTQ